MTSQKMGIKGLQFLTMSHYLSVFRVNMNSIVVVLFLAFAAAWADDDLPPSVKQALEKPGQQYALYQKHTQSIGIRKSAGRDTVKGLNIDRGNPDVNEADLALFYRQKDVKFAVKRFMALIDDDPSDKKIEAKDLTNEFDKKHYKVALSECNFIKSPGLRQSCFADQLLTYVLLCVGEKDKEELYKHIAGDDGKITKEDITTHIKEKIENQGEFDKDMNKYDLDTTFEELGGYFGENGDEVTKEELFDYISQESILDDFRRCRESASEEGKVDFGDKCLTEELVEYTQDDLTDLDIAVLFRIIDDNEDDRITEHELKEAFSKAPNFSTKPNHRDVLDLLDRSGPDDQSVDFAEFRAYLRSPTVLIQLEKDCTENIKEQKDEIVCLLKKFKELAADLHYPIWLEVPDLDQVITFEDFDTTDDGKLTKEELKDFGDAVDRFLSETDTDESHYVCLEEFNEYLDIPHMVYGTADCLAKSRTGEARGQCFKTETVKIVENIKHLEKEAYTAWFKSLSGKNGNELDKVIDESDEFTDPKIKELEKDLFLTELGQGSEIVTEFEFTWYVKQQELAEKYKDKLEAPTKLEKQEDITALNEKLVEYIQNVMTEYDIVELFKALDQDDNGELTEDDFNDDIKNQMKTFLKQIDGAQADGDEDETVNFQEFWIWINAAEDGKNKKDFEKDCSVPKKTQLEEMTCYVNKFKKISAEAGAKEA